MTKVPASDKYTVRFNPEVRTQLEAVAAQKECTVSVIVREAVREYLKSHKVVEAAVQEYLDTQDAA